MTLKPIINSIKSFNKTLTLLLIILPGLTYGAERYEYDYPEAWVPYVGQNNVWHGDYGAGYIQGGKYSGWTIHDDLIDGFSMVLQSILTKTEQKSVFPATTPPI